mgnify:CR=1 FL=1
MTWYADEILLRASPTALECVGRSGLAPFAYHLKSLHDHHWHSPDIKHGLPEGGLLVIRAGRDRDAGGDLWQGCEYSAASESEVEAMISPAVTAEISRHVDERARVPVRVRGAAAYLAREMALTIRSGTGFQFWD